MPNHQTSATVLYIIPLQCYSLCMSTNFKYHYKLHNLDEMISLHQHTLNKHRINITHYSWTVPILFYTRSETKTNALNTQIYCLSEFLSFS